MTARYETRKAPHSSSTDSSSTRRLCRIFAAVLLIGLAASTMASAGQPRMKIWHSPDPVNDQQRVTIHMSGTHHNGCVPQFESGQVYDGSRLIEIVLVSSDGPCTQAVTPWNVNAKTGYPLSAGWWTVKVYWGSTYDSYRFEVFPYATHRAKIGFSREHVDTSESAHTVYLVVERSGSDDGEVTVDYRTRDGSAEAGEDYEHTSGTLTWYHGDTSPKKIPVVIYDDHYEEYDEDFRVELSYLTGDAEEGTYFDARVTIRDDDTKQGQGNCHSDDYTMCLGGNRFEITSRWRTRDGKSGRGQVRSLTDQSGYFWFFSESNVEVLVKMLDGCSVSRTHWFFASGMTNVWVEITVEDTWNGQRQTYTNPMSRDFALIKDTETFGDCR